MAADKMYGLFGLLALIGAVRNVVAQCSVDSIPIQVNFQVQQLEGHWFLLGHYTWNNQSRASSGTLDIVSTLNGLAIYLSRNSSKASNYECFYYGEEYRSSEKAGRYTSLPAQSATSAIMIVVAMNYTENALLYICSGNVSGSDVCSQLEIWVLGRQCDASRARAWIESSLSSLPCSVDKKSLLTGLANQTNPVDEACPAECPYRPIWGLSQRNCSPDSFQVQVNFNLSAYMGVWKEMAWLAAAYIPASELYQDYSHNYVITSGNNVTGYVSGRDSEKWFFYEIYLWQTGVPGKMMFLDSGNLVPYNVMLTDYDHFAVVYGCYNISSDGSSCNLARSWIWSRDDTLDRQRRLAANSKLLDLCLNPASFLPTQQNRACVKDNPTGKKFGCSFNFCFELNSFPFQFSMGSYFKISEHSTFYELFLFQRRFEVT